VCKFCSKDLFLFFLSVDQFYISALEFFFDKNIVAHPRIITIREGIKNRVICCTFAGYTSTSFGENHWERLE
jgi:hypothetical protein